MTVVVADTSVYVSALVFGGVPQAALIKALTDPFRIAVSHELKAELVETLEAYRYTQLILHVCQTFCECLESMIRQAFSVARAALLRRCCRVCGL